MDETNANAFVLGNLKESELDEDEEKWLLLKSNDHQFKVTHTI